MPAPGPDAPLRLPPRCNKCQASPVAWTSPRVDFCYDCLPGGPFTTPPCRWCGTTNDYFSQGLCVLCHPRSPQRAGSCKGCLAWGVYPRYNWTCWPCRWWRTHYPEGTCDHCGRLARIGNSGACRLCVEQAQITQEAGRALDYAGANQHSQQLFLANMLFKRRVTPRLAPQPSLRRGPRARNANTTRVRTGDEPWRSRYKNQLPYPAGTGFDDEASVQLALFDMAPDPEAVRRRALLEDSELTRYCAAVVDDHAERYGWSVRQRNDVIRSLRLLQTLRENPTAKIRASDVLQLPRYDGNIVSTIDVLADAGLLIEDRPNRVEIYFAAKAANLPPQMREQLELWLNAMLQGSTQAPRQVPRDPQTARVQILGIVTVVNTWVEAGYTSFAQVTRADIEHALEPLNPGRRHAAELGLKSLFKTLKGRKLVFANPTRGIKTTTFTGTIPLALDPAVIRTELNHPDPVVALAVALVAFHALTGKQLRAIKLTDIVDGRLTIGDRVIPLAAPVLTRLTAWLDHRNQRWPNSLNPHLLVSRRTAPRLVPVGHSYPWKGITLRPQALREDRILHEIHATGGDVRRIYDLFGLNVDSATRYLKTIEHPDLANGGKPGGAPIE
ncbi:hypothetical protein [Nocardioides lacusdianchii]|uniref:hypothetical protein n=1 Tax=Nocardioides lacusdianchii TaxID=2783664 RepID=UPI001CCA0A14|nr:hypothetical protein [Nocardioides lacusdianchii]